MERCHMVIVTRCVRGDRARSYARATSSLLGARRGATRVVATGLAFAATAGHRAAAFLVLAVALLVLLARAARARVVAADLGALALDRSGRGAVTRGASDTTATGATLALSRGGRSGLLLVLRVVLFLVGDALLDHLALLGLQGRDGLFLATDLDAEQLGDDVLGDPVHHLLEQGEAGLLVFLLRILLAVALEAD